MSKSNTPQLGLAKHAVLQASTVFFPIINEPEEERVPLVRVKVSGQAIKLNHVNYTQIYIYMCIHICW